MRIVSMLTIAALVTVAAWLMPVKTTVNQFPLNKVQVDASVNYPQPQVAPTMQPHYVDPIDRSEAVKQIADESDNPLHKASGPVPCCSEWENVVLAAQFRTARTYRQ
jgi:hypothetical protein